ncbi:MAG: cytosol nonspecific dipeptidase [Bacteroidetes bacterium GWA2_31_9b]|nr:MAG: cytosol nonspecific dipeptidase [Bacteroidetes bacterium GWA2_31_9b]
MSEVRNLNPKAVWEIFQSLCDIPRPSKHEQKVIEYVKKFGENLGLETIVDEIGNVIIKKPASKGMEDRMTVVLQGHLDMVPQKNSDIQHDFEKDPIQSYVDGEWVTAKDTTLGADNGIGVAAAMAVLQDKNLVHGPIEALFTIDEETGMTGAENLKSGILNGDIMMNLDSEDEGELYIGCAGGVDTVVKYHYKEENVPADFKAFRIDVKGLKGGHSGLDINMGRGNSNKILNRILYTLNKSIEIRLSDIDSGSLRNAVPREGFAIVVVAVNQVGELKSFIDELTPVIKAELSGTEPGLEIKYTEVEIPKTMIDKTTHNNLIKGIYGCPNGVIRMSDAMPGLVETSTNLAIVKKLKGFIQIDSLQRSSVDSAKEDLANMIRCVFEMAGAEVVHQGAYPGWKPNINSPILKTMKEVYNTKYGKVPEVKAIHAGLECGIIGDIYPNFDMISFGPTIRFPHSPDEKVKIDTVQKFYDFLLETLKNIPKK